MIKRKDNLTDAVEALQSAADSPQPEGGDRQVVDQSGEIITLGQSKPTKPNTPIQEKGLELSVDQIGEAIKSVAKESLEKMIDKYGKDETPNKHDEKTPRS